MTNDKQKDGKENSIHQLSDGKINQFDLIWLCLFWDGESDYEEWFVRPSEMCRELQKHSRSIMLINNQKTAISLRTPFAEN